MRGNSQGWRLDSPVSVYKSVIPLPALESLQRATLLQERNEVFNVPLLTKVIHCVQQVSDNKPFILLVCLSATCCFLQISIYVYIGEIIMSKA